MKKQILKATSALLAVTVLFTSSCKKVESKFTASKTTAEVGEPIVFTDGGDAKLKNLTYSYDFGDGSEIANEVKNPSHTYAKAGTYTVSQFVTKNKNLAKGKGQTASSTITITITSATADFTVSSTTPQVNEMVTLTNTTSGDDGLGSPVSYVWSITGNGTNNSTSSTDKNTFWKPTANGVYVIRLTASQGNYSKTIKETTITVGGGGVSPAEFQGYLAGTWTTVTVAGNHTGAGYGASGCGTVTPATTSTYATLAFDGNGASTYGTLSGTTTFASYAGNVTITFATTGYVNVSGNIGGTNAYTSISGLYQISGTPSQTSIVLTKTKSGTCGASLAYTDAFTITLSR